MNNDLFFISKIEDAIEAEDPYSELETKIAEIISTGQQPGYTNGLYLFSVFFNKIKKIIDNKLLETQYVKKIEQLWSIYAEVAAQKDFLELFVYKGTEMIAAIPLKTTHLVYEIKGVSPALYSFALSSGRVIWKGQIEKTDLLWSYAYPEKDFRLAADTEGDLPKPTKQIAIFDGEIIVRVFSAIETGNIQIEVNI